MADDLDLDADIEALTSAAATDTTMGTTTQQQQQQQTTTATAATAVVVADQTTTATADKPAEKTPVVDETPAMSASTDAVPVASSPVASSASSAAVVTPAKEERKIGKLNLSAFAPPAQEADKSPAPAKHVVGKLSNQFVLNNGGASASSPNGSSSSTDAPPPARTVGKLGVKLNIPIFAPGQAPPPAIANMEAKAAAGGEGATASATEGTNAAASSSSVSSSSADSTAAPTATSSPSPAASPSSSSSSAPRSTGKLAGSSALMQNLNAMLGAGGNPATRKARTSMGGDEALPASVTANTNAATTNETVTAMVVEEEQPAAQPTITHVS